MKEPTVRKLREKLDIIFSQFIRQRDKGKCYTCSKVDEWKYMQCGHYIPRAHNQLRFSEINCHSQCPGCNMFHAGRMDIYALNLIRDYGPDILKKLNKEKQILKQWKVSELEKLIKKYKKLVK